MRRVPPSVIVREELDRLLAEGADQETNIVLALVDTGLARTAHLGRARRSLPRRCEADRTRKSACSASSSCCTTSRVT
jgi:hypothetical protein